MSDTEGLCLNVTVPRASSGSIDTEAKLPVLVFIHGGGFTVGSGVYPQYDMARFVRLSVKEGRPCITVITKCGQQLSKYLFDLALLITI